MVVAGQHPHRIASAVTSQVSRTGSPAVTVVPIRTVGVGGNVETAAKLVGATSHRRRSDAALPGAMTSRPSGRTEVVETIALASNIANNGTL
ncbi:MAG: hypothetical protein ACTHK1_00955 [Actinomycetales bacterium]